MRISDWSSDVCSSDLLDIVANYRHASFGKAPPPLRIAGNEHGHGIDEGHSGPQCAFSENFRRLLTADRQIIHKDFRPCLVQMPNDIVGRWLWQVAGLEPAITRHLRHISGIPVKHRRSEAHTSELHSLMRISYAVFCLTKQTNKQPIT